MLGIIPAGTTNDFARALGISRDIEKACDVLCEGHFEPIDIGRMNQKYFTNIAAAGTLTELTYEVPAKLKTIVGQLAYYIKGWKNCHKSSRLLSRSNMMANSLKTKS